MSVAAAFSAFTAIEAPMIPNNFDTLALPNVLNGEDLPCKITLFDDSYYDAASPIGYEGSSARFTIYSTVLLLYSFIPPSNPPDRMSAVLPHIDGFLSALQGNWTLGGLLESSLRIEAVQSGIVDWNGMVFIGSRLRCQLPIRVEYDA